MKLTATQQRQVIEYRTKMQRELSEANEYRRWKEGETREQQLLAEAYKYQQISEWLNS